MYFATSRKDGAPDLVHRRTAIVASHVVR